jgi:hypothetical protein
MSQEPNLALENGDFPSPEAITYVTMLSAFQVVLNCQLELKGTIYDQGQVRVKVREAVNALNIQNSKNRNNIWKIDDLRAASIMRSIQLIGEQIAKANPIALDFITDLTRQGVDFDRCIIKELTEDELKDYKEQLAKES